MLLRAVRRWKHGDRRQCEHWKPPLILAAKPDASLRCPPPILASPPLAMLSRPPQTLAPNPKASLIRPPLTLATLPLAVLNPPLTLSSGPLMVLFNPATSPPKFWAGVPNNLSAINGIGEWICGVGNIKPLFASPLQPSTSNGGCPSTQQRRGAAMRRLDRRRSMSYADASGGAACQGLGTAGGRTISSFAARVTTVTGISTSARRRATVIPATPQPIIRPSAW
jgi:hypothetical protein